MRREAHLQEKKMTKKNNNNTNYTDRVTLCVHADDCVIIR